MTSKEGTMDQFEIHVKQIGKGEGVLSFFMDATANVLDLKKKISTELKQTNEDVPTDRQRLIFSGRMLRVDEENLKDARLKTDSVNCIHLTPLPAGANPSSRDEGAEDGPSLERGAGERRRFRLESMRAGFHPYAFAIPVPARLISAGTSRVPSAAVASARSTSGGDTNSTISGGSSSASRRYIAAQEIGVAREVTGRASLVDWFAGGNEESVATINLLGEPLTAGPSGFITMLERSIAGSVAVQESSQLLRRVALDHLLAYTRTAPVRPPVRGRGRAPVGAPPGPSAPTAPAERTAPSTSRRAPARRQQQSTGQEGSPRASAAPTRSRRRPRETTVEPQELRRSTRRRHNPDSST